YHRGGCFWIDASGSALDPQFHGVLRALDETVPSLEEMRLGARGVRAELTKALDVEATSKSILVVVDNVPEPAAGPPLALDTWCPGLGRVACLATSRKRLDD